MSPTEVRCALYKLGWRQGAYIGGSDLLEFVANCQRWSELAATVRQALHGNEDTALLVAIVSSCDVIYGNLSELPCVEFQICRETKKSAANKKYSDHRFMVLQVNGKTHRAHMKDSVLLPKELLLELPPDATLTLPEVNSIVKWKTSHYNRLALPESLVERLGDCLRGKPFKRFIEQYNEILEGIYFEVSTLEELAADVDYSMGVIAIVKDMEIRQAQLIQIGEELEEALLSRIRHVDGVILLNDSEYEDEGLHVVMTKQEVTFDMLERFRKYYLDHFSLDPEHNDSLSDLD
ncbi:hypothetical protein J6I92_08810 [Pseudidiomarina sp. 1APR75-15]|uniref:Uncharacterized protein n=1 Tax=Pseudidiomarina terrestris TaxID=2820060 RepID=A0ABT8MJ59_9GAMM|nr:hypothetical protein [Pseudidiomarina sp. 1APR75-15]MDN7129971.1 hypothetical protein [Pseudidiomarina sp. 1APR75-15]